MKSSLLSGVFCLSVVAAIAWLSGNDYEKEEPADGWTEVAPGILRSPGLPAGYALIDGETSLLIDAPMPSAGLSSRGIKKLDAILLTHHHRDTCAALGKYVADKVPIRAPKASAAWLNPENVRKYWKESLPLRNSNASYL